MANPNTNNKQTPKQHHPFRTLFASLFGFLALNLILVSILVLWLDRTLTNTDQYVKTVAPLVTQPAVQNFVVDKASSALLDNSDAPVRDISEQLLGKNVIVAKTDDQLRILITPIVKDSVRSVVSSPAFAILWKNSNKELHSQLISQLNSGSNTISLNFHPVIVGVIDQLGTTKLSFVKDKLKIKDDMGVIVIRGKQLDNVHKVYDYFKKAMLALIVCAALAAALCVLISVHHLKTIRRIALFTGIFAAILALMLSAASLFKAGGADVVQQKAALAIVDGITLQLRLTLFAIAAICITGAIGSKVYAVLKSRKLTPQPRKTVKSNISK